jgi:site-specific recombinase XerD
MPVTSIDRHSPEGSGGIEKTFVLWLRYEAKDGRNFRAPTMFGAAQLLRYPSVWLLRAAEAMVSTATLEKRARSISRWLDYGLNFPPPKLPERATVLEIEFATRSFFSGFIAKLTEGCQELNWAPMRLGTAQIYGTHVVEFAEWLQLQSGFGHSPSPDPWVRARPRNLPEIERRIEGDLLGHLYRATREGRGLGVMRLSKYNRPRWDLKKQLSRRGSDSLIGHPDTRRGYQPAAMALDDYLNLLQSTKAAGNWRDVCLWLLLGAGCCRVSEALNLFATDVHYVLGARQNGIDAIQPDEAIVALANPVEGLIQAPDGKWIRRREFLKARYGLEPRNLLPTNDSLYAGYKGMALGGTLDCSIPELEEWPTRGWALIEWLFPSFGRFFADAHLKYRQHLVQTRLSALASEKHPYLLMNEGRSRGDPLTRFNVNQLLAVACKRAGIKERAPHSLRHLYGATCASLGIPVGETQIRMRHSSLQSTLVYYKMSRAEARAKISAADKNYSQRREQMRKLEPSMQIRLF